MRRIALFLAALTALSCSSAPPMPAKPMNALPSAVVDAMCAQLHAEGMTSEVRVVKETQALVTPAALRALAEASFNSSKPKLELVQAILATPLVPVEIPAKTCVSRFVSMAEAARVHDVMLIQFSSPFVNPYGRGQSGALARLTLGGETSTWYWVPIINHHDQWLAGAPSTLSVIE